MSGILEQNLWLLLGGVGVLGLLVGLLLGGRFMRGGTDARKAAEVLEEHERYRQEVTEHFERSAQLFSALTDDYRQLYAHLADGSQKLAEGVPQQLAIEADSMARSPRELPPDGADAPASARPATEPPAEPDMNAQLREAADSIATVEPPADHPREDLTSSSGASQEKS